MRKFTYEDAELFISSDQFEEYNLRKDTDYYKFMISSTLDDFIRKDPDYYKFLNLFSKVHCLSRYAILEAHGCSGYYDWYYIDGEKHLLVQTWINKMDGKYAALILRCCNEGFCEISSEKSIIFAPNYIYSPSRQSIGDGQVEMYVPGLGYIDHYAIEYEIKEVEKQHRNL